jgi:phosphoribosylanthranilate isomerase
MKIKICGITDPKHAPLGADYIGLVFCPRSPRFLSADQAIPIAQAARDAGSIPVAVFSNHNANEMIDICSKTQINYVQLHGAISRNALPFLPENLRKIYAISSNSSLQENHRMLLNPERDFLLYDSIMPGSGQTFDWASIKPIPGFYYFIAGGLRADNIQEAIRVATPYGIDLSSGVEITPGIKATNLINELIGIFHHD